MAATAPFLPRWTATLILVATATAQVTRPNLEVPLLDAAIVGDPRVMYASTGPGIWRSIDDGIRWEPLALRPRGQLQPFVPRLVAHPANNRILYALTEAADGAIWRTADGGDSWVPINTGLPQTGGQAHNFIISTNDANVMWLRIDRGLYKTTDGGATWKLLATTPLPGGSLAISMRNNSYMLMGISAGMYRSVDEGANWFLFPSISIPAGAEVQHLLMDPFLDFTTFVATLSPNRAAGGMYVSTVSGLDAPEAGMGNLDPNSIFNLRPMIIYGPPVKPFTLFTTEGVCPTSQGRPATCVARSLDNGRNWRKIGIAGEFTGPARLGFQPNRPTTIIAATARGPYLTTDNGDNWVPKAGTSYPTLTTPNPIEFRLVPGATGRVEIPIRVIESDRWLIPVNLVATGGSWLRLQQSTATTPVIMNLQASTEGLEPGTYEGSVRINSTDAVNGGATVPVRLVVALPAVNSVPEYTLDTFAGNGSAGNFGDNAAASRAVIGVPDSLAIDPSGNIYISLPSSHVIRRVAPNGRITRFAGNAQFGFSGDGGQALLASFFTPRGIAVGVDRLFLADSDNNRLRWTALDGQMTQTQLNGLERPRGIAVDERGTVYAAVPGQHVVVRIEFGGRLSVFAGTPGVSGFRGEGIPATGALLSAPQDVALGPDGSLYIADTENHRIRVVRPDGTIRTVAGSGLPGFQGDFDKATDAALNRPSGVAADATGIVFFSDTDNNRVRMVTATGAIRTIGGTGVVGFSGDEGLAAAGQFRSPTDIVVDSQGILYVSDSQNLRVRSMTPRAQSTLPTISEEGVFNIADRTPRLAPGSLFSLNGVNFATETVSAPGAPWPQELGGVSVTFDGNKAALSLVSPNQINGQVPYLLGPSTSNVAVSVGGVDSRPVPARISAVAPAVLLSSGNRALVLNEDGTLNSADNPAPTDSVITLHVTGLGTLDNAIETGAAAPDDPPSQPVEPVRVTVGRELVTMESIRMASGKVGVAEVRVRTPSLAVGDHPVVVTQGGVSSNIPVVALR